MGRIDQETVNRILDAADIVEVVSDFVKLRRSGANYKGLCPFHNERTPSFSVNRARIYASASVVARVAPLSTSSWSTSSCRIRALRYLAGVHIENS